MRTGQESWGCSVWKREGSREILLQVSSTCMRLKRKTGKSFLPGPAVIGQRVMGLK